MTHTGLAKTCLTYLNFQVFDVPCIDSDTLRERRQTYVFSSYAAHYWAFHARKANTGDVVWSDMLITIADTFKQNGKLESVQQLRNYKTTPTGKSLIHVLLETRLASNYIPPLPVNYTYVLLFDW